MTRNGNHRLDGLVASEWRMEKSAARSTRGMVVAKEDAAAVAGAAVLSEGGNAIDAAVTAAFVMSVMQPYNCGIAGAGYLVLRRADRSATIVDFSARAPANAPVDAAGPAVLDNPLQAAVPGTVAGLCLALERYGTMPLRRVLEPAIEVAEHGMPLTWLLSWRILKSLPALRRNPHSAAVFLVNGDPGMAHGASLVRQPDLARTLTAIADDGPRAFYEGAVARSIAEFVQSLGGVLEESDLARYQATVAEPLVGRYKGMRLIAPPLPSPAVMTVQGLEILSGMPLKEFGHNSEAYLHSLAEAYRLSFADRDAYFGDPDFMSPIADDLLDPEYVADRRRLIGQRAMDMVTAGDLGPRPTGKAVHVTGTTHLSVIDGDRNAVSLTQTLMGGFSGIGIAGDTGVLMNTSLQWFDPTPGSPNSIAPGKRPVSNMTPMILDNDHGVCLSVGAPGGRKITNAVSQVALNVAEFGRPLEEAVSSPRIDLSLGHIVGDNRIPPDVFDRLRARGHKVELVKHFIDGGDGEFARPAAVLVDEDGVFHGADYPFLAGAAVGVA